MKKTSLKSRSHLISHLRQRQPEAQITVATPLKEDLQAEFHSFQSLHNALHQKDQLLALAEQRIAQQQQQLQAARQKSVQQAVLLAQLEAQLHSAQRLKSLDLRVGEIIHDLNNVLCPILSLAQLLRLQQPRFDDRSQALLQLIETSAKRGASLLKELLSTGTVKDQEQRSVRLTPLLQEVSHLVQATFPKTISLRQQLSEQPLWGVAAEATHLHQVLMNLCVNARDAMPEGGVLTLAAANCWVDHASFPDSLQAQSGHYVVITITDTGTGIPLALRSRIFEPLFTTKQPGQGTGLGLATVCALVKHYGGFLQVFSEVGEGTAVKVFLPAVEILSAAV
ncbi:MAG: nitrogen regulation protein NR(II) (plasmid) [Leptolyngbya sp. BL-A-14]